MYRCLFFPFRQFLFIRAILRFCGTARDCQCDFVQQLFLPVALQEEGGLRRVRFGLTTSDTVTSFYVEGARPIPAWGIAKEEIEREVDEGKLWDLCVW